MADTRIKITEPNYDLPYEKQTASPQFSPGLWVEFSPFSRLSLKTGIRHFTNNFYMKLQGNWTIVKLDAPNDISSYQIYEVKNPRIQYKTRFIQIPLILKFDYWKVKNGRFFLQVGTTLEFAGKEKAFHEYENVWYVFHKYGQGIEHIFKRSTGNLYFGTGAQTPIAKKYIARFGIGYYFNNENNFNPDPPFLADVRFKIKQADLMSLKPYNFALEFEFGF